ncbi:MAG: hypothetical protein ACLTWR_08900 [Agathobaculum desmolans]|uniref:hypothetical protein n=1 Tax=Agathobaculum desmolans TaxID=39484 RepID=UPI0039912083
MATIRKIYDLAAAILFSSQGTDADFDKYAPLFLERLLMEALPYENMIRAQRGEPCLQIAPEVTAIDETEIDWDDRITRSALPHGLVSCFMADEADKKAEMVMEYNKFVQALEEAAPALPEVAE